MRLNGPIGLTVSGNLAGALIGMPWQALLAYTVVAVLCTTAVALAKTLVPQKSYDRVLWWSRLLRRRQSRPPRRRSEA